MHAIEISHAQHSLAPCDDVSSHPLANGVPDRRVVLLQSAVHYLESARRWGTSHQRAEAQRCIEADLRALGAR